MLAKENRVILPKNLKDLEDDIRDKSKASSMTKLVALVQIVWFVIQLVGRAVQQLPTSLMEMFTLAVVICSTVSYAVWWHKPLDVAKPIKLETIGYVDIAELNESTPDGDRVRAANPKFTLKRREELIPLYAVEYQGVLSSFLIFIMPVFAVCHLIAWNWSFPSNVEQLLWRISSVGCAVLPALFGLAAWAPYDWCRDKKIMLAIDTLYVVLRMYMLAETFAALRLMPEGVYSTVNLPPWPHFGGQGAS
jgi:hypothetical protein